MPKKIVTNHVSAVLQSNECNLVVPFKLRAPDTASLGIDQLEELLNRRVRRTRTALIIPGIGLLDRADTGNAYTLSVECTYMERT